MELLEWAGTLIVGFMLPFLFVLTIVVFFHELGHFLVARWCGVGVEVFSVGFGRELVGFNDRHGTRWKFSLVPLGGFVKFAGDSGEASTPDREAIEAMTEEERAVAFHTKPLWARAAVVAAGPAANFLLAIVIFSFAYAINGKQISAPIVDQVQEDSAAAEAGIQPGDLILDIDDRIIESFTDLQRIVSTSAELPLVITIRRGEETLDVPVTPRRRTITDQFGNEQSVGMIGITRSIAQGDIIYQTYTVPEAVVAGVYETWFIVERTVTFLGGIFSGRESVEHLGGPIRIAEVSGQVATLGPGALINLAAFLSVSIGLINLFPIPVLDGGHLLFYAIEALRGRPLSERVQDIGFRVGLVFLLMLMVFVSWNDVLRLVNRLAS